MGLSPDHYRNLHAGEDIYVIGSGPSLNHFGDIDRMFARKRIVSCNHGMSRAMRRLPDYLVTKYHQHAYEYLEWFPDVPVVVTRYDRGNRVREHLSDDVPFIVVDHPDNTGMTWNAGEWPSDASQFIATWSTITTAMHWAAHLGAANIVLVGHDCGHIDDVGRVPGYRQAADGLEDDDGDRDYWRGFDLQSRQVKRELERRYGCNVVSLDPFINRNCEGHTFRSYAGTLNG